jgi:hypothetical protein
MATRIRLLVHSNEGHRVVTCQSIERRTIASTSTPRILPRGASVAMQKSGIAWLLARAESRCGSRGLSPAITSSRGSHCRRRLHGSGPSRRMHQCRRLR